MFGLGDRQAWRDMIARVDRSCRRSVDIIEVQVAHSGAISEGGKLGGGPQKGADDRGRPCAFRKGDLPARSDRPFVERRNPASQRINDMSFDALHGGGVDIAKAQAVRTASCSASGCEPNPSAPRRKAGNAMAPTARPKNLRRANFMLLIRRLSQCDDSTPRRERSA
jgi:hypothetical protein